MLVSRYTAKSAEPGNPYGKRRIGPIGLLVLTRLDQLHFKLKTLFNFFTKQDSLKRTIPSFLLSLCSLAKFTFSNQPIIPLQINLNGVNYTYPSPLN